MMTAPFAALSAIFLRWRLLYWSKAERDGSLKVRKEKKEVPPRRLVTLAGGVGEEPGSVEVV